MCRADTGGSQLIAARLAVKEVVDDLPPTLWCTLGADSLRRRLG
jgi:hypothetical protein